MPWRPEDWKEWPVERWVATYCEAAHRRAVRDIVRSLPSASRRTVIELTRGPEVGCPFLAAHFTNVVPVRLADGECVTRLPAGASAVVAVDTIRPAQVEHLLPGIHGSLVEGGVLLATFAATSADARPFDLTGAPPGGGVHEVGLQYRLRRSGFQGVRLRRFRGDEERLLCMAVRRALN